MTKTFIDGKTYSFTKENVDGAPETAGVYALYQNGTLIYYGRAQGGSVTIRSRLQSHQRGDEGACTKKATDYKRETLTNPVTAEKELLEHYEKQNGKLPSCNSRIG